MDVTQAIEQVRPSIVQIVFRAMATGDMMNQVVKPIGTGFFINSDGYLITAYHVIEEINNLMEQYKEGQTEDIQLCKGTALHYTGIAHRQMGDFLEAKKHFLAAKEKFPRFEDYNFIEDLKLDGIISDEGFAQYIWWNNEKILEELG